MTTTTTINGIDLTAHLGLIGLAVRSSSWAVGASLEWDDLFQWGFFGLHRAAQKFDASRGYRFSTYAMPWVRHYVRRAAMDQRRTVRVPVWVQERRRAGAPTFPLDALSLDAPMRADQTDGATWLDTAADECEPNSGLESAERSEVVERGLARLPERLRDVLRARFWGGENGDGETLAAIGLRMNLSRERVRQLESDALELLREKLEESL